MKNMYDGILKFKGTWRVYQKRVLDHSEKYLEDGKIHIVAAPGSGKTTLGIELIRRLGAPCLILSPSITIRQQWLERIKEGFLMDGQEPDPLLSNDLRQIKPITAITYQTLHGAMKRFQGELKDEDGGDGLEETTENVDFSDFHLFDAVAEAGIRTICLDEAHHLRSEWWKALENFLKQEKDMTVISLTATPPYDSTPGQWKRYIDMCGPIDEEIFTPELVREGSLCPHEDYICFNWPAKEELKELEKLQKQTADAVNALLSNDRFSRMIAAHKGLKDPEGYSETFLERPEYFSSLLIFCQDRQIPFPPFLKKLIGAKGRLPKLDSRWLQVLLQGFLFDDTASYDVSPADREAILIVAHPDFGRLFRLGKSLIEDVNIEMACTISQVAPSHHLLTRITELGLHDIPANKDTKGINLSQRHPFPVERAEIKRATQHVEGQSLGGQGGIHFYLLPMCTQGMGRHLARLVVTETQIVNQIIIALIRTFRAKEHSGIRPIQIGIQRITHREKAIDHSCRMEQETIMPSILAFPRGRSHIKIGRSCPWHQYAPLEIKVIADSLPVIQRQLLRPDRDNRQAKGQKPKQEARTRGHALNSNCCC